MSDDKVIRLPGSEWGKLTNAPREETIPPINVLNGLIERVDDIEMLIVIGVERDGRLTAASTHMHTGDNLLLLERARRKLLMQFGEDEFS